jgi:hypothetical protein
MKTRVLCFVSFVLCVFSASALAQTWDYRVNPAPGRDHETQCISPAGNAVGGWVSCKADGSCESAAAIRNRCEIRHGALAGEWTYFVDSKVDTKTMCVNPAGRMVGDWRSCHADRTCGNPAAIVAMCVALGGGSGSNTTGPRTRPSLRTSTPGSGIFFYVTNNDDISYNCTISYTYSWDDFGSRTSRSDQTTTYVPAKFNGEAFHITQNAPDVRLDASSMNCN